MLLRQWHPTPVLLPGKSHGWRSLVGCSPWGRQESDTTERLHFHFSLSCIGEGNGNPLQYSCLDNLRDRGAWWAAIHGVAQSRTWLSDLAAAAAADISIRFSTSNTSNFSYWMRGEKEKRGEAKCVCIVGLNSRHKLKDESYVLFGRNFPYFKIGSGHLKWHWVNHCEEARRGARRYSFATRSI